jgi:uncharacterized protein (DUF1330 family)
VDEATHKDSEFMKQTVPTIKAVGGKYLAGGFNNGTALSGASPANRIVLLQFETIDKAKAWYADGQGVTCLSSRWCPFWKTLSWVRY